MSNRDRDFLTRSESKKRSNKSQGRKNLDRLLNVLIAIVAVLILINLYFVFSSNSEKAKEVKEVETNQTDDVTGKNDSVEQNKSNSSQQDTDRTSNEDPVNNSNNDSTENVSNNPSGEDDKTNGENNAEANESQNTITTNTESMIVQESDDSLVEQIIIDPNWDVTPTAQNGEHVSTYKEGHIDYEEMKLTIRNAVGLEENNIIYWRVGNNGKVDTSIAVVSSNDKQKKYRVSIEWITNQGWKPVKVEILKELEGAY